MFWRAWGQSLTALKTQIASAELSDSTIGDLVDLLVEITRTDAIQKVLIKGVENEDGMEPINDKEMTIPLWHLIRVQTVEQVKKHSSNYKSICLCLHPSCSRNTDGVQADGYGFVQLEYTKWWKRRHGLNFILHRRYCSMLVCTSTLCSCLLGR